MDQEIQQLFRNVESGRVDLLPKLGALLNRSDASEYSDYQLDLFKNIEPPCFLLPIKE